jgi:hypothetical protein
MGSHEAHQSEPLQDITSFSGFGSWMASFTPAGEPNDIHEADSHDLPRPIDNENLYELGSGQGPVELSAGDIIPAPTPIPSPHPVPVPIPAPLPIRKPVPAPSPKPVPAPPPTSETPEPNVRLTIRGLKRPNVKGIFECYLDVYASSSLSAINKSLFEQGTMPAEIETKGLSDMSTNRLRTSGRLPVCKP